MSLLNQRHPQEIPFLGVQPYQTMLSGNLTINDAVVEIIDLLVEVPAGFAQCPPHLHTWYELNYVFEGHMQTSFGGSMMDIHAGEFFLIPPGMEHAHAYEPNDPHKGACLRWRVDHGTAHMPVNTFSTYEQLNVLSRWKPGVYADEFGLGMLLTSCFENAKQKGTSFATLLQVVQAIFSITELSPERKRWTETETNSDHSLLRKVEIYLNDDQSYDVDVHRLAASLHMSYGHLARKYKKLSGQTIIDRMGQIRLERSLELLRSTDQPIQEIAYITGLSSLSYYSRLFKKMYGMSPKEYRDKGKEKE
ncbi:helix-turn-helix domain-containing protein [Paenibacillus sp. LMG 31461]|uniref:Helix-turn-helix domain-containing protein n=1 Tax=Paenibacillus plantarum TaxID=2654975 RepID=A0ABX1XMP3_9BACL|nr:AraC family transcriptional regulator [Paenibacillus plantarum]NOU69820.1 helix-turn-helix domain-containing protein [Paenibacillus plantarum]